MKTDFILQIAKIAYFNQLRRHNLLGAYPADRHTCSHSRHQSTFHSQRTHDQHSRQCWRHSWVTWSHWRTGTCSHVTAAACYTWRHSDTAWTSRRRRSGSDETKRTCSSYANTTRGILVHVKYDTSTLDKSNTIFMKNKKKVDKSNYYLITSGTHPVVGAVTAEHVHAVDTHAIVETRWRQTIIDVRFTI